MGYTVMTSVQQLSVPAVLGGGDVLIQSQTGSGKPHNIDHSPLELFYTLSHKTLPPFLCQILFSKCLHCWKACEICYKPIPHYPPHLRHVAILPWEIKNSIFGRYSADMEANANKLHCKCTDFNFCTRVTVYAERIYVFLSKCCSRHWIFCWLVTNTAATAVTNFWCHKFNDRKSKQVKEQWHIRFYLQSVWGKTRNFIHQKYQNL